MADSRELQQIYCFSDTYGEPGGEYPFEHPDADALITTDLRGFPFNPVRREFDITQYPKVTDHLLRTIVSLREELESAGYIPAYRHSRLGAVGVLINSAPRVKPGQNGDPFFLAELVGGAVRVVAPARVLSAVKTNIDRLQLLPNDNNPLFGISEQFRSAVAPFLLDPRHGLTCLQSIDKDAIPDPEKGWRVAYIDKFGHLVTHNDREKNLIDDCALQGQQVQVSVRGEVLSALAGLGITHDDAPPGELLIYRNGPNVDIARKWKPQWSEAEKRGRCAYADFSRPRIGDKVDVSVMPSAA